MFEVVEIRNYNYICPSQLSITLSPKECGIENDRTFNGKNRELAYQYIHNLLVDINEISAPDILFSIGGHSCEEESACTFYISWEF